MCCEHATKSIYKTYLYSIALKIYTTALFECGICTEQDVDTLYFWFFSHLIYVNIPFFCFKFCCSLWRGTVKWKWTYLTEIGYNMRSICSMLIKVRSQSVRKTNVQLFYTDFNALFKTLLFFSLIHTNRPENTHTCTHTYIGTKGKNNSTQQ